MSHPAAYIEWDPENQEYVGVVPGFPDARVTAPTLDELQVKLQPVLERCRAAGEAPAEAVGALSESPAEEGAEESAEGSSSGRERELYPEI